MAPDACGDCKKIGAGLDQRAGVVQRDAANRNARRLDHFLPPNEQVAFSVCGCRFGLGWKKRAEGDVIGAGFGRLQSQVARGVASDPDNGGWTNDAPGLGVRAIRLADVNAIGVKGCSKIRPIIDQHSDVAVLGGRKDTAGQLADLRIRGWDACRVFKTDLKAGDVAGVHRSVELACKCVDLGDDGRGDQIKSATRGHGARLTLARKAVKRG